LHNIPEFLANQKIQNNNSITLWFYVVLSEKNEVVYRDWRYFGAKSNGYDVTMKIAVKGRWTRKKIRSNTEIRGKDLDGIFHKEID
jgi:hypothetical protein